MHKSCQKKIPYEVEIPQGCKIFTHFDWKLRKIKTVFAKRIAKISFCWVFATQKFLLQKKKFEQLDFCLCKILVISKKRKLANKHFRNWVRSFDKMAPGLNFINILCARFSYESAFLHRNICFSLVTFRRKKYFRMINARIKCWWNWRLAGLGLRM